VIEVAMGDQHCGRPELVLGQQLIQLPGHPDPRIHHDALLAWGGRHHEAVRAERVGLDDGEEHANDPFSGTGGARALI
jgi:hypothetical protein